MIEKVKPYLPIAALVLAAMVFAWFLNRSHNQLASANARVEAAELALKHQIVSATETAKSLRADKDALLVENKLLADALEEAKIAVPEAKVVVVDRLRTMPVVVADVPRETPPPVTVNPPPLPPCPGGKYAPDGLGSFYCLDQPKQDQPKPVKCVLASGDTGSFAVDEVVLSTDKGNRLVVGTAEFWRETPGPRSKLAAGKFSSALSDANSLEAPSLPRWGAELMGYCTVSEGCGYGAGVLLPPARFLWLRWEARAGALLGPSPGAYAALGARW